MSTPRVPPEYTYPVSTLRVPLGEPLEYTYPVSTPSVPLGELLRVTQPVQKTLEHHQGSVEYSSTRQAEYGGSF